MLKSRTFVLLSLVCLFSQVFNQANEGKCWRSAHSRKGIDAAICPNGWENVLGICWERCRSGYSTFTVGCWEDCARGYRNDGAFCFKPAAYGRSYAFWDKDKCTGNHDSCSESWGMWYGNCRSGYKEFGLICTPACPGKSIDIGISCAKDMYFRGTQEASCPIGYEKSLGRCYKTCEAGFFGIGPTCLKTCPPGWFECGAVCSQNTCEGYIKDSFINAYEKIQSFIVGLGYNNEGSPVDLKSIINFPFDTKCQ
jgi:hypothetical protein